MASERHEIQVGIAIVVAVGVLIFGLLWFQNYQFESSHRDVQARFSSAGGLGVGDPVHVRGIPMGKVSAVELHGQGVLVTMSIDANVNLRQDALFSIGSQGLVGERKISCEPGSGPPIPDGPMPVFEGRYQIALAEMAGMFDRLNRQVIVFLARVDTVLAGIQAQGGLGPVLEETTRAARATAQLMEENAASVREASRTMAAVGRDMKGFFDEHGEALGQGIDGMATTATKLDSLVAQLREVATGSDHVLTALREQEGAMGKLIYDEKMGEDLQASVKTLRFLVDDILRNPGRYLTVKIF